MPKLVFWEGYGNALLEVTEGFRVLGPQVGVFFEGTPFQDCGFIKRRTILIKHITPPSSGDSPRRYSVAASYLAVALPPMLPARGSEDNPSCARNLYTFSVIPK